MDATRCVEDEVAGAAWHQRGVAWLDQGNAAEAITAFEYAAALRPGFAETYANLGLALAGQERFDEALITLEQAERLELPPGSVETHFTLGQVFEALGRGGEAAEHYAWAARLRPDLPEIASRLAIVLAEQGKRGDALEAAQQAARLGPGSPETCAELGTTFLKLRRFDEAIAWYRQALAIRPVDPDSWNNLGTASGSRAGSRRPRPITGRR